MSVLSFATLCFSSLFTVIDPIGAAPVFASLTNGQSARAARRTALRACLVALGVLAAFALFGAVLFRTFGITLDAFRIGGGIVFLLFGIPMLTRDAPHAAPDAPAHGPSDPAIVPLGVPMIGGPGAITTVMVLMGQSQGALHTSALFAALGLVLVATWAILGVAPALTARLGSSGMLLLTKVMALILIVIGVQFVVDGLKPIAVDIVRSAMAPRA